MALTAKMIRFAEEYIVDLNATQAAIRAGYSENTARAIGAENLTKPDIQEYIQKLMDERSKRVKINADMVLEHWMDIAYADPNELMQIRRLNCRYCHGIDHEYQWIDENEYVIACESARSQADDKAKDSGEEVLPVMPSDVGGYGFNKLADPNKSCPKCLGEGKVDLHIADTRKISMQARRLFAGVKQTQSGVEIKFRDQDKAMENIARHLGMFKDKVELSGSLNVEKLLEQL